MSTFSGYNITHERSCRTREAERVRWVYEGSQTICQLFLGFFLRMTPWGTPIRRLTPLGLYLQQTAPRNPEGNLHLLKQCATRPQVLLGGLRCR